ncbi:MAG: UDP-N-acetylmuramate dehydrogenase, partial [Candidatus Omnitrophica bacterium]|nr:UDP-N-acetylmuramate dehydrogenase [Candidatus Omnitrophota bacterium]
TTLKIGGSAEVFIEPTDTASLIKIIKFSAAEQITLSIIGRGSNLLVKDEGVKGIVIRLNSPEFTYIKKEKESLRCGAGAKLADLLKVAEHNELSGLEFAVGIPASVGGAIKTNLGTVHPVKKEIKELIDYVKTIDLQGKESYSLGRELDFSYRCSNLFECVILEAKFNLQKADKGIIKQKKSNFVDYRRKTQGTVSCSAGCIFKNPQGEKAAAYLIEQCGLKGKSIGGAEVSCQHSNFIINRGQKAKASDILALIKIIEKNVKKRYNVKLELEVEIWE